MNLKLNKSTIDRLPPPEGKGYVIHWDTELRGFGLRITSSGTRSFILQTRIRGRERRITIGRYPDISPDTARKQVKVIAGEVAGGGDPIAERERRKLEGVTLSECFDEYLRLRRRRNNQLHLKDSTKADMSRALDEDLADWQAKPITKITRDMVKRRYAERAAKSPVRANVAFRYLRAVLNFAAASYRDAEGRPVITDNPVRVLSELSMWGRVQSRRRVMDVDQVNVWIPAVLALAEVPEREPGQGKHKPKLRHGEVYRDFFLFLALTGCRKGEALGLRKSNVDLHRDTVTFKDTKNRTDHVLPLTPRLRELLVRRMDASTEDLVFVTPEGRPLTNMRYALARIVVDSGVQFSPHDLRRLCATTLERLAVPVYTIKAVLNHLPGAEDVTGRYVQVSEDMKLEALLRLDSMLMENTAPAGRRQ